jgi:hypothetical protein
MHIAVFGDAEAKKDDDATTHKMPLPPLSSSVANAPLNPLSQNMSPPPPPLKGPSCLVPLAALSPPQALSVP